MMTKRHLKHPWEALSSTEMAAVLILLIIAASLAGAFTPYDIYHSPLFAGLLTAFGINLLACTVRRILKRKFALGSLLAHIGILVILAGVITGTLTGKRGQLSISEGEVLDSYRTRVRVKQLPFKIRLDDFNIEWKNQSPNEINVRIKDKNVKKTLNVEDGALYRIDGTNYSIEILRFVPDLVIDRDKQVTSRSSDPNNPALLIRIAHDQKTPEDRWVFAKYPDFTMARDDNIIITYRYGRTPLDFASSVTILDNDKTDITAKIRVNHPFKYKGYSFYQSGYDPTHPSWTNLEVVFDPGVSIVFTGIVLLNLGVIIVFYRRGIKS